MRPADPAHQLGYHDVVAPVGVPRLEDRKAATLTRLTKPEQELSAGTDLHDVRRLTAGQLDTTELYSREIIEFDSVWGRQHAGIQENFAQSILSDASCWHPG